LTSGGPPDVRWNADDLHIFQVNVHGSDFEAVDESSLMISPDFGFRQSAIRNPQSAIV
jgi:hypothetical protein